MRKILSFSLLAFLLLIGTNAWADAYETVYTFTITKPGSGAVSDYTKTGDMVIDGITWTVPGNWYATGALRLGGKSISNVDRTIISQGKISSSVSKITVNHGGVTSDNMVLNSVTLTVASNSTFTENVITKTVTPTYSKNTDGSFDLSPNTPCPANRYYKIAFNLSNSNGSNYAFVLKSVVFQKPATTPHTLSSTVAPASTGTVSLGSTSIGEGNTTTIEASANTGYYFVNWTVSGEGSSVVDASAASTTFTMGTEDATVTANFAQINYWVVTYDYNDGVTDDEEVHVLKANAASYNLKAAPSRYGYNFTGWKIGSDTYAAEAAYEPTDDVSVQAQWEFDDSYLVTYNRSSKSDLATGAKYVMGASYTTGTPSTTTWKFATGMGSNTYLGASVVGDHGSLDADEAVFFDETPEIITLTETADGWTMTNESGKKIGLTGDKKLGYNSGDMTWDLGGTEEVPTFSATRTANQEIHTHIMKFNWNSGTSRFNAYESGQQDVFFYRLDNGKNVYTLTLDFNYGEVADETHQVLETASYTPSSPTRSGYTFLGWSTSASATSPSILAEASYTMPAANTTLYAVWWADNYAISLTANTWATFCFPVDVTIPSDEDLKVYSAAFNTTTNELTATNFTGKIAAGDGVLLKSTKAGTNSFTFEKTTGATPLGDSNDLIGTLVETPASTLIGSEEYLMALKKDENKFVPFSTSADFPAYRACLAVTPNHSIMAAGVRIVENENNTTSIANINASEESVKFIQNGKLFIKKNGVIYDMLGTVVR